MRTSILNFTLSVRYPHRLIEIDFDLEPPATSLSDDPAESQKQKALNPRTSYDIRLDQARELSKALDRSIQMLEDFENRLPPARS